MTAAIADRGETIVASAVAPAVGTMHRRASRNLAQVAKSLPVRATAAAGQ
jgi:hypothetical protein